MRELFLFVRPPRPLWPFNGPTTAFWPPLAFASLAAALRDHIADLRVEILDAPALEMGWRTLESEIHRRQPAYVGLGEEAVSCVEGLRLAQLAQDGGATVIAGGCFFGHVAAEALSTGLIDVVVQGEGEQTLVELIHTLRDGTWPALRGVAGLSFMDGDEVVTTRPRPLLENLDELPWPAYDLLPYERYGRLSRNHPNFAAIESSRGCVGACDFCVLWRQMGRHVGTRQVPCLRTKSAERLRAEVHRLRRDFERGYLGWVDPCFNAHPGRPAELAERLLRDGIRIGQSAWVRADGVVRDAESGALATCVRAGLNEMYIGVERPDTEGLHALNKTTSLTQTRRAFEILAREFPEVFTFGSFIYGLPGDSPAMMRAIYRLSVELEMDKAFFIPLTPLPGTPFWRTQLWDPTGWKFRHFSFLPSAHGAPGRAALDWTLLASFALDWSPARIGSYVRGFRCRDARKRRMTRRILGRATWFSAIALVRALFGSGRHGGMVLPRWYES